jgi:hypothetical protein
MTQRKCTEQLKIKFNVILTVTLGADELSASGSCYSATKVSPALIELQAFRAQQMLRRTLCHLLATEASVH